MQTETIDSLIEKYLAGNASIDEKNQLNNWYDSFTSKEDLYTTGTQESDKAVAKGFLELKLKLNIK